MPGLYKKFLKKLLLGNQIHDYLRKIKKLISYFGMAIYTTNQPSRYLSIGSRSIGKGLPLCPRRFKTSVAGSSIGEQKGVA